MKRAPSTSLRRANFTLLTTTFVAWLAVAASGGVLYVDLNSTNPSPPFADWTTAATNIQEAIDAAAAGDTVLVTNGVYAGGGRVMAGDLTNRIALDKALTVQSVNGPFLTTIRGNGATNGNAAVRCAWLTNGAVLQGFTLTAGATRISGDQTNQQSGGGIWCTSTKALIANCVIKSNTASWFGAAVFRGTLNNCLVSGNAASPTNHGVVTDANLSSCTVISNAGWAVEKVLALQIWLTNCIVYFNEPANHDASGFYSHCCTTTYPYTPSGFKIIFNKDPGLLSDGLHLANDSPCRGTGTNLTVGTDILGKAWADPPSMGCTEWQPDPLIDSQPVVQLTSNPIGFRIRAAVSGAEPFNFLWTRDGVPIENDGHYGSADTINLAVHEIRSSDAGNYQLVVSNAFGVVTGELAKVVIHYVNAAGLNPTPPYTNWATAATRIQDAINVAGSGEIVLVTNGVYASGGKAMAGTLTNRVALDKAITVVSVNGFTSTIIQGVVPHGPLEIRCAWLTNNAALSGFTLWNGGTQDSGLASNLAGGGFWGASSNAVVANCVLTNNWAVNGGGAAYGSVVNSVIVGNTAWGDGGGAYYANLNNCTVVNNSCRWPSTSGGTHYGRIRNSIISGNWQIFGDSPYSMANYYPSTADYAFSCTSPRPPGTGNTNLSPQFLDTSGYHLPAVSPLRGAGSPLYSGGVDNDGEAWATAPSMGADEVVDTNLTGPVAVELFVNLPLEAARLVNRSVSLGAGITGRAARLDWAFGDGSIATNTGFEVLHIWTNAGEYTVTATVFNHDHLAGISTNVVVRILPVFSPNLELPVIANSAFRFSFSAQNGAKYSVQFATNLAAPILWQTLQEISQSSGGITQISDPAWPNEARFYRVLAQ